MSASPVSDVFLQGHSRSKAGQAAAIDVANRTDTSDAEPFFLLPAQLHSALAHSPVVVVLAARPAWDGYLLWFDRL
jgi:hypothetical protein